MTQKKPRDWLEPFLLTGRLTGMTAGYGQRGMQGVRGWMTLLTGLLALGFSIGARAASANVVFLNPEKSTDIGRYADPRDAAANRAQIARHIEQLAARNLPPNQVLKMEVLDVSLAGRLEPWRARLYDTRIMRQVTWPSIKLRYQVQQDGQVVASGEETVADMNYLERPNRYPDSVPLSFEKRMLDDWFRQRLGEHRPAPQ